MTILQNELNHEHANAEVLTVIAAIAGTFPGQELHFQPASILHPEKFDSSWDKLPSFLSHLYLKLVSNPSHFLNP
jgi:hypothetical protein